MSLMKLSFFDVIESSKLCVCVCVFFLLLAVFDMGIHVLLHTKCDAFTKLFLKSLSQTLYPKNTSIFHLHYALRVHFPGSFLYLKSIKRHREILFLP